MIDKKKEDPVSARSGSTPRDHDLLKPVGLTTCSSKPPNSSGPPDSAESNSPPLIRAQSSHVGSCPRATARPAVCTSPCTSTELEGSLHVSWSVTYTSADRAVVGKAPSFLASDA